MQKLIEGQSFVCNCGKVYDTKNGVLVALPTNMDELAQEELEYHDSFVEDAGDVHQLSVWRNKFYHEKIQDELKQLPHGSLILEIGAGSGTDARELVRDYKMVLSDISPKTLERLVKTLQSPNTSYVAADGMHLPFSDKTFDAVYMVATFHHFENPNEALSEIQRVLKAGGLVVLGVEPNSFYFRPVKKLRSLLCKATHMHTEEGSHADAEMEGFSYGQLKKLFNDQQWGNISIRPMWLCAGWMHYGLEFMFRVFKMKKRIIIPLWLEKGIVGVDEVLFSIPGVKYVGWHWNVVAKLAK